MRKLFAFALVAMMLVACSSKYQTLPMDEFEKAIQEPDVVVVDVRTPREFSEGHIAGAINIDWKAGHFAEEAAQLFDKDKTIAV